MVNSQIARRLGITPEEAFAQHGAQITDGSKGGAGFDQVLPEAMPPGMENGDGAKLSAMYSKEDKTKAVLLGQVDSRLVSDGAEENAHLGAFSHSVDQSALNHIRKNHGDEATETARGQLPVADSDIGKISDIIKNYDGVRFDLLSDSGKPAIAYVKKTDDGVLLYMEEVRNKRHDLAALSMRKYPATADVQKVLQNASPNVRNDGGHGLSIGKPPQESKSGELHQDTPPGSSRPTEESPQGDQPTTGRMLSINDLLRGTQRADGTEWDKSTGQPDGLHQDARGYYSPEHRMIAVLKDANLSTYIHETGHYLLDTYTRIASMSDAPPVFLCVLRWTLMKQLNSG